MELKRVLNRIIKEKNPQMLCLQETNFKNNLCANIRGYLPVFKNRISNHASGGVSIYEAFHVSSPGAAREREIMLFSACV